MAYFGVIGVLRAVVSATVLLLPLILFPVAAQQPSVAAVANPAAASEAVAGIPHPNPPRRPALPGTGPVFRAIELRDWSTAYALAAKESDPLLSAIVSWVRFTTHGERVSFDEVTAFISAHPDWPAMADLRIAAEEALDERIPAGTVIRWFEKHPPLTAKGAFHLAQALIDRGRKGDAETLVRKAWTEMNFAAAMERAFYNRFRVMLRAEDHVKRIDRLLWNGRSWEARRMMARIKGPYSNVALARMRLRDFSGGVDWAIRRVPDELLEDPGFVYERMRWRRRKGRDDEAIEMIEKLPDVLPRPDLVWREQEVLARRALREGKITLAYRLASRHRQVDGASFAEAEFLAGFIALRFLKEPADALNHFKRLHEKVNFPVSKSRGAYWAGRAARELKQDAEARKWFAEAAQYMTAFYGQLAAVELMVAGGAPAAIPVQPDAASAESFSRREVARAAELISESRERGHFRQFVRHLVTLAKTPAEHAAVARIALAAGRPDVAVWAARDSLKDSVQLIEAGWPRSRLPSDLRGLEPGLVFGLIRQESGFDVEAVSWAGARGLMQVMPATAERVAAGLGLPFSRERLLGDPDYNMTIGTAYIAQVLGEFSGSYVLALAAYNAGPGRARRWLAQNGDFRTGEVDAVDWIELIPFEETRNYVQRVIENVQIYRALLDEGRMSLLHPARMTTRP